MRYRTVVFVPYFWIYAAFHKIYSWKNTFPQFFLLEKPLIAYTPFRHHSSLGKNFFQGKTGFFFKRKLKTLGKFQKHFGNFFRDLRNYFGKCTRTNSIWENALEKCSSRLKLFSLRKKNSKSSPSKKNPFSSFLFSLKQNSGTGCYKPSMPSAVNTNNLWYGKHVFINQHKIGSQ